MLPSLSEAVCTDKHLHPASVPMAMCIISYVSYGYLYNGEIGVFFWIYALGLVVLMLDAGVYLYKQLQTGKEA